MTSKVVGIAWSHGRPRTELRRPSDGGTPALPETVEAAADRDVKTGRFVKGNGAARRRALKTLAKGVATLNPAACPAWLKPHVVDGASYAMELLTRFPDAALARLVGATADAHTLVRALLSLGAKGDGIALREARQWNAEHRACLRELASLASVAKDASTANENPHEAHERALVDEREARR